MNDAKRTPPPAELLRAFVEELVRSGVRDVVICPGSRSTPLALALRSASQLRSWVHLDERAGAFFALGAAKASGRPTAILVTSGTAAVELTPAVVEARHGRVPLVALTADRPPELRDRGAPQAIDQDHLFGRFKKWYAELPVPEAGGMAEAHVRSTVGRAVAEAMAAPAGPVHLNLPYREPLVPAGDLRWSEPPGDPVPRDGAPGDGAPRDGAPGDGAPDDGAGHAVTLAGARTLPEAELAVLVRLVAGARRGVIVCGPLERPGFAEATTGLAEATGFPIIADALANVRFGPHDRGHVISRADAMLRASAFVEGHRPDLVLRFGATPTSRTLLEWITASAARQVVVDDGGWTEPTLLPVTMVQAEPVGLARALTSGLVRGGVAGAVGGGAALTGDGRQSSVGAAAEWLTSWRAAEVVVADTTEAWLDALDEPFEGQVFAGLGPVLPDGAILFAGNSMPVRDMDAFLGSGPAAIRCLGNRGASGIDGLVSTALGVAAVAAGPVVAVVGDVSFIHDLNALVAATRLGLSMTLVLVDNDGGGIFSFLPQADADAPAVGLPEHFEELFGTPHGLRFGPLVRALGAGHQLVAPAGIAAAVARSVVGSVARSVVGSLARPGVQVLEVRTERTRNAELHRALLVTIVAALESHARDEGRPR
jgi:2-succinyl-5-enolpyruvyl-6-hydroxy-3-cyclohexene-1-carboxylate synthase